MLDSLFIGTSGLQSFSAGLKVISNNISNLNTAGFKSSSAIFANLYYADTGDSAGGVAGQDTQFGSGVALRQTLLNFKAGDIRQTGNALDLNINGTGFFITRDQTTGQLNYTRAGQFDFRKDGTLVVRGSDNEVMSLGPGGVLESLSLNGLRINAPKPTSVISLGGNLTTGTNSSTVSGIKAIDSVGGEHTFNIVLTQKSGVTGTWIVKIQENGAEVGSGELPFSGDKPTVGQDSFSFTFTPKTGSPTSIKLDFSSGVTNYNTGSTSSLAATSVDGYGAGSLTKVSFDDDGALALSYSNGQNSKGPKLALALFNDPHLLTPLGGAGFSFSGHDGMTIGSAKSGGFGSLGSNQVEGSNVDLASEFSDLIVAQRGYQAASRIVSTANELIQDLLEMKGNR